MSKNILKKESDIKKVKRYVRVDRVVEYEKAGYVKSKDQSFSDINPSGAVQNVIKSNNDLVLMEK